MLTAKQLSPAEAQEYGIFIEDYVLKPITHRELYDAIEHVLREDSLSNRILTLQNNPGSMLRSSLNMPA